MIGAGAKVSSTGAAIVVIGKAAEIEPTKGAAIVVVGIEDAMIGAAAVE